MMPCKDRQKVREYEIKKFKNTIDWQLADCVEYYAGAY